MGGYKRTDFWVFGYASLMWRPEFDYVEKSPARLYGYHRSLCVSSIIYRGTPKRPGLVFGLENGGACRGCAFRIASKRVDEVLGYLRKRELVTGAYHEKYLPVHLLDAEGNTRRRANAVFYAVDRRHSQYAGQINDAARLDRLLRATGKSGDNLSYVRNTLESLREMDVRDSNLTRLWRAVERRRTRSRRNR
ncbi:MAG: gamma-glutamylcyclotransferase [Hyphomicrobiales bacterium]|nr:gamma-glutamylcyclotransferase [Hyphomicrobiales bacterium]